jgi:hypothetical protein
MKGEINKDVQELQEKITVLNNSLANMSAVTGSSDFCTYDSTKITIYYQRVDAKNGIVYLNLLIGTNAAIADGETCVTIPSVYSPKSLRVVGDYGARLNLSPSGKIIASGAKTSGRLVLINVSYPKA